VEDLDGQLRGLLLQHVSDAVASSGVPFLDLAANQVEFAALLRTAAAGEFARLGLALDSVTVQNLSLPEELQKVLDQKIGMGMVGGSAEQMGRFMQYQTAQAIPEFAGGAAGGGGSGGGGGVVGDALGLGAGVALGQVMAQQLGQGLQGSGAVAPAGVKPDEVMATLEKLAGLKTRGIITEDEFAAKKAELLKKLA
jgi:membrane protease subunit (stomatin/prohibitin family)